MAPATQLCPICRASVPPSPRYPRYVCARCCARAATAEGRPLVFYNLDLAGGFVARRADTGEVHPGHECFIDGVRCLADEARFGGIVVEPAPPEAPRRPDGGDAG